MADAAARNEARRKKILENAQSRLEKITGRKEELQPDFITPGDSPYVDYLDSDDIQQFTNTASSSVDQNGSVPLLPVENFSSILRGHASSKNHRTGNPTGDYTTSPLTTQSVDAVPKPTNRHFLFSSKSIVILLAILVRLVYIYQLEFIFSNMIFVPLILFELSELVFKEPSKDPLGIWGAALLLCGLPSTVTNSLTRYIQIVRKVTQDFCLYMFTFVVTHLLLAQFGSVIPQYYERI